MKLTELEPKWISLHGWASESIFRVGLTFRCPHCMIGKRGETGYLGVYFANPIDPDNLLGTGMSFGKLAANLWQRTGDSFDNLTLTPSIDVSQHGHWHGYITNGEIR